MNVIHQVAVVPRELLTFRRAPAFGRAPLSLWYDSVEESKTKYFHYVSQSMEGDKLFQQCSRGGAQGAGGLRHP